MARHYKRLSPWEVELLWGRWQRGKNSVQISEDLGCNKATVVWHVMRTGGLLPRRRRRAKRAFSLREREEISRGIARAESSRSIARHGLSHPHRSTRQGRAHRRLGQRADCVRSCRGGQARRGKRLGSYAQSVGKDPYELAVQMLQRNNASVGMVGFAMSEENLDRMLAHPFGWCHSVDAASAPACMIPVVGRPSSPATCPTCCLWVHAVPYSRSHNGHIYSMTATTSFTPGELRRFVRLLTDAGLATPENRRALMAGINPRFAATIPGGGAPTGQLLIDLDQMNVAGRLADGSVPFEIWLGNAVFITDQLESAREFRDALAKIRRRSLSQPEPDVVSKGIGRRADSLKLPESKERIIHQNDLLPFGFLAAGVEVGRSVARIRIKRHNDGTPALVRNEPVFYLGTAWMIGASLAITNHHVINARGDQEPPANSDDFALQGATAIVEFDYDSTGAPTFDVNAESLVASDARLDYAVLRLATTPGRRPIAIRNERLSIVSGEYVAVNIIQHPGGLPKQIAVRNNLITDADERSVRYFTDTLPGSSGSPVLDDEWRAVALHRGSTSVGGVQFQGRDTAWVNVGSPIHAILKHLRRIDSKSAKEISVG